MTDTAAASTTAAGDTAAAASTTTAAPAAVAASAATATPAATTPAAVVADFADFKVPEGAQAFSPEELTSFKVLAKDLGLSQEAAQKLVDFDSGRQGKASEALTAQLEEVSSQWRVLAENDKEFGGDKLKESLVNANKALEKFGSKELVSVFQDSRLGNHPEVIRFLVRIQKALGEDTFVTGSPANGAEFSAKSLYPNSPGLV